MLTVCLDNCFGTQTPLNGNIVMRWGRAEERWLQTGAYPFGDPPQEAGPEATVRALAGDLEAAFDPDTGDWFDPLTESGAHRLHGAGRRCRRGLDAAAFPHLTRTGASGRAARLDAAPRPGALRRPRPSDESPVWELDSAVGGAVDGDGGPKLWEPLTAGGGPEGWHEPAGSSAPWRCVWQGCPDLREAIPLERILDFWCESIKTQPLPLTDMVMGGVRPDDDCESLACAAVALQVGSRAFSEPEYAQARDALLDRMRETGRERPLYQSMLSRADRGQPADVRWSVRYDDVFRFAAVYGQTCAFIGNTEELDKVRDWAGAVLARQGDDGGKLFQRYQYARFETRCALLAAVRGRAPMFAGPPPAESDPGRMPIVRLPGS